MTTKRKSIWNWARDAGSRTRALDEFSRTGFSRFKMPDAVEMALSQPGLLVERMTGRMPSAIDVNDIKLVDGTRGYTTTNIEALFHADCQRNSAALQILICKTPADCSGGESRFLDTWAVADKIREEDPELFEALFDHPRLFNFVFGFKVGYTFSLHAGSLRCRHPAIVMDEDEIGLKFQSYIDRAECSQFLLGKNEVALTSNHRMLHGRTPFKDSNRHLIRILAWFDQPIETAPQEFVRRARKTEKRLEMVMQDENSFERSLIGIESPETEIARLPERIRPLVRRILCRVNLHELDQILGKMDAYQGEDSSFVVQSMIVAGARALAELPDDKRRFKILMNLYEKLFDEDASVRRPRKKAA